jgi:hypothetical protein
VSGKSGSTKSGGSFPETIWANVSLSSKEVDHCRTLVDNEKLVTDQVWDCVATGLKFSLNRDDAHACFVASFTRKPTDTRTHQVILTGRGSTATDAVYALLYKHLVVTEGAWEDQSFPQQGDLLFG